MTFALRLGEIQTQVILSFLYFVVFAIGNSLVRLLRKDFLRKRTRSESFWLPHDQQPETLERYKHQF